jgi:hypothetical protein
MVNSFDQAHQFCGHWRGAQSLFSASWIISSARVVAMRTGLSVTPARSPEAPASGRDAGISASDFRSK